MHRRVGELLRPGYWPLPVVVVPAGLMVLSVSELLLAHDLEHRGVAVVCTPLMVLALVGRRRWPVMAAITAAALFFVQTLAGVPVNGQTATTAGLVLAVFALGRHAPGRSALFGMGGVLVLGTASSMVWGQPGGDAAFALLLLTLAFLAGYTLAHRERQAEHLVARAAFVEATAEERAQEAVEIERRRIARELHDVIAHAITVMVLQAAAAETLLTGSPDRAKDSLVAVQAAGRGALVDMKRLLGVLRSAGGEAGLAPQPTLSDLPALVEQLTAAGLDVQLVREGDLEACPSSVAGSAYQIVREALTNTLRHAGPTTARVSISCTGPALEVDVSDDGRTQPTGTPGYGLVGIRERVAAFGGEMRAGPRSDGGFSVHVRFPLAEAALS